MTLSILHRLRFIDQFRLEVDWIAYLVLPGGGKREGDTLLGEGFADDVEGDFRGIALLGEVGEGDMLEAAVGDVAQEFAAGFIG